jgi:hypothetical protein
MTYNPNIPQGNQSGADTQAPMLNNFASLKTATDINHVTFDLADQGKHPFVSLHIQQDAPTTLVGEMALSALVSNLSGVQNTELALRHQSNATNNIFTAGGTGFFGWTRLPSGLLIKWMNEVVFAGSDTGDTIDFVAATGPRFVEIYAAFVSPSGTNTGNFTSYILNYNINAITVWSTLRYGADTGSNNAGNILAIGI